MVWKGCYTAVYALCYWTYTCWRRKKKQEEQWMKERREKLLWNAENFENFLSYIADGRKSRWWKFLNVFSQPSLAEIYRTLLAMLCIFCSSSFYCSSSYVDGNGWLRHTHTYPRIMKIFTFNSSIKFNFHNFSTWINKNCRLSIYSNVLWTFTFVCSGYSKYISMESSFLDLNIFVTLSREKSKKTCTKNVWKIMKIIIMEWERMKRTWTQHSFKIFRMFNFFRLFAFIWKI